MAIVYGEFINSDNKQQILNESISVFPSGHFSEYKDYGDYRLYEMSAEERNDLEDDDFGIPELRKYPIHDKKHVEQAVKMFNHVDKRYESELADNLLDAMERYHISTNIIGDKNRLKKYIKEETTYVTEGIIWNDNTPEDIKKLKEDIREKLKSDTDIEDIVDITKDSLKNKDFTSDEKKLIYDVLKKVNLKVCGYTIKTANYGSIEISNNHSVISTFKNYIITLNFTGVKGKVVLMSISINYNGQKSKIPKNVAFDCLSLLSPNVDKVRSTNYSLTLSALSDAIDSGYPRISHKYSKKYNVKKSFGGLSIKISTWKSVKESASPVAAALPRQDFQPDAVYIINYLKKNTFDRDIAVCKDKMSSIFICDGDKPIGIGLTDFKELASDIKVYRFLGDSSFDHIVRLSKSGLDFYRNTVGDSKVTLESLDSDWRFNRVNSYLDELNSIEECIIHSAPKSGLVHEIYCPVIPLVNMIIAESSVHFFRDVDGVFAQNINTLARSASYEKMEDIPKSTINILKLL